MYLTKILGKNADAYLGYRDNVYIAEEFEKYANNTVIVTEDGSHGQKGFVTDYIDFDKYDVVLTCGQK